MASKECLLIGYLKCIAPDDEDEAATPGGAGGAIVAPVCFRSQVGPVARVEQLVEVPFGPPLQLGDVLLVGYVAPDVCLRWTCSCSPIKQRHIHIPPSLYPRRHSASH